MRVLGVGETCDLGALYMALQREGHEVRLAVSHPLAQGTLAGLVERTFDWRAELQWVQAAPDLGVILFESVTEGFGAVQDDLRRKGFNVVGGSAFGDRLENDRGFAQALLTGSGFPQNKMWPFDSAREASRFVEGKPARYVAKFSGADHDSGDTYVGLLDDGRDLIAVLASRAEDPRPLILMPFIEGVETGVGAFFNGERFMTPANLDWEHKRFFPGDLGELTGEMGTVVTYERAQTLFQRTLARLEPRLRAAGHVGYVNLNTIINEAGVWPLEFSCRFGYPGYTILAPLQAGWGELLRAIVERRARHQTQSGFCTGVVLTTPPFPYSRETVDAAVGLPVIFAPGVDEAHLHFGEVGLESSGQLATSGLYGWTLVVTGIGPDIEASRVQAYRTVAGVTVPNLRYRADIGERLAMVEYERLESLGVLDAQTTQREPLS